MSELVEELLGKMEWDRQTIAVGLGDFTYADSKKTSEFGFHFSAEVGRAITDIPNVTLVNRSELDAILDELGKQRTDFVDPDTAKPIGKIPGLDAILIGKYSTWENEVRVEAKLIWIENAKTIVATGSYAIPGNVRIKPEDDGEQETAAELERQSEETSPVKTIELPETKTAKDTAMVLVPAGEFAMGSDYDHRPELRHTVYLDDFYIDTYEVTNKLYERFMDATDHKSPDFWSDPGFDAPDQPVVGVSWDDAQAYCLWAGKRLPTEAEWEKAARGGLVGKKYPWGDGLSHDNANYEGTGGKDEWDGTSPVHSFAPNGYGLYNMSGNVFEWCSDCYDEGYYERSPRENPTGPNFGTTRVIRGGSWNSTDVDDLSVSTRNYCDVSETHNYVGFRCVKDVKN